MAANKPKGQRDVVFRRINGRIVPIKRSSMGKPVVSKKAGERAAKTERALIAAPESFAIGAGFGAAAFGSLTSYENQAKRKKNKIVGILKRQGHRAIPPTRPSTWDLFSAAKFERDKIVSRSGQRRIASLGKRMQREAKVARVIGKGKIAAAIGVGALVGGSRYLRLLSDD